MDSNNDRGPGAKPVGATGISILIGYLTLFAALLLYLLVTLWPVPTPSGKSPPGETTERSNTSNSLPATTHEIVAPATVPLTIADDEAANTTGKKMQPVSILGWRWDIADEVRLLMLVICAGALGSLVHGLRSIYWYVGNRGLIWSWIPKYLLLPFSGAVLAVVFYFVIRGGFFSPDAGFKQTSPFGFAALSAMVGMFSEQAVLKLKEIAETLLSKPPQGKNAEPQDEK